MKLLEKIGVEFPIFQWTEPRAAASLNRQGESWPTCKKFIALFLKFGVAIGLPVLIAIIIWFPKGFASAIIGLSVVFGFCFFLPVIAFLQDWAVSKAGIVCAINKKGLVKNGVLYEWENLVSHQFHDHPGLPNLRVLSVNLHGKNGEQIRDFHFDPAEVNESEIRMLIEPHLAQ